MKKNHGQVTPEVRAQRSYAPPAAALGAIVFAAMATQTLVKGQSGGASVTLLLVAAVGLALYVRRRAGLLGEGVVKFLASAEAAVVVLVALLVGTILGTVVLQTGPALDEAAFRLRYPNAGGVLQALHFDDMFHSVAYRMLLWLLAIASLVTVYRRKKAMLKWHHIGLLTTHISVMLVLIGGLIGSLWAKKGMMHLLVGESADRFVVEGSAPEAPGLPVGFSVRLDRFEIDHHTPEFKLYTYKTDEKGDVDVDTADAPKVGITVGDPEKGATVTVDKVYERLRSVIKQPSVHRIGLAEVTLAAKVGDVLPLPDGGQLMVQEFVPDFFVDVEHHSIGSHSDRPNNPALVVDIVKGDNRQQHFLFAREAQKAEWLKVTGAPGAPADLSYSYQPAIVEWVEAQDGPPNPAVDVTIRRGGGQNEQRLLLAAEQEPIALAAGRTLVFREKPEMIKNYHSTLSIVKDGQDVLTQEISVNNPLFYEGYGFYQANFDPNNPRYSGIEVVRDPGLMLVEIGMWGLFIGVLQVVVARRWKPWWERRRPVATQAEVAA